MKNKKLKLFLSKLPGIAQYLKLRDQIENQIKLNIE